MPRPAVGEGSIGGASLQDGADETKSSMPKTKSSGGPLAAMFKKSSSSSATISNPPAAKQSSAIASAHHKRVPTSEDMIVPKSISMGSADADDKSGTIASARNSVARASMQIPRQTSASAGTDQPKVASKALQRRRETPADSSVAEFLTSKKSSSSGGRILVKAKSGVDRKDRALQSKRSVPAQHLEAARFFDDDDEPLPLTRGSTNAAPRHHKSSSNTSSSKTSSGMQKLSLQSRSFVSRGMVHMKREEEEEEEEDEEEEEEEDGERDGAESCASTGSKGSSSSRKGKSHSLKERPSGSKETPAEVREPKWGSVRERATQRMPHQRSTDTDRLSESGKDDADEHMVEKKKKSHATSLHASGLFNHPATLTPNGKPVSPDQSLHVPCQHASGSFHQSNLSAPAPKPVSPDRLAATMLVHQPLLGCRLSDGNASKERETLGSSALGPRIAEQPPHGRRHLSPASTHSDSSTGGSRDAASAATSTATSAATSAGGDDLRSARGKAVWGKSAKDWGAALSGSGERGGEGMSERGLAARAAFPKASSTAGYTLSPGMSGDGVGRGGGESGMVGEGGIVEGEAERKGGVLVGMSEADQSKVLPKAMYSKSGRRVVRVSCRLRRSLEQYPQAIKHEHSVPDAHTESALKKAHSGS